MLHAVANTSGAEIRKMQSKEGKCPNFEVMQSLCPPLYNSHKIHIERGLFVESREHIM